MLHRIIAAFCAAASLLGGAQERSSAPDPKYALTSDRLAAELKRGGYTLYFRHTATDFSQSDAGRNLADCRTQRNLTDAGREQARQIGRAIAELGLPLGEVIASPYCRTIETGRLIAGQLPRAEDAVRGRAGPDGSTDYSGLAKLISTPPAPGTIRLIAGHGNPMRAIAGPPHLEEGEVLVVKPFGTDWAVVSRLRIEDWEALRIRRLERPVQEGAR